MKCVSCGKEFPGPEELCDDCRAADAEIERGAVTRRRFLGWTSMTMGGLMGVGYLGGALRYLYPANASGKGQLQDVGAVTDFVVGTPKLVTYLINGFKDGVYVVNLGSSSFIALDFHCTHLQCPVHWAGTEFFCPCHGSSYNIRGLNIGGPAPRPLYRHYISVENGRVLIGGELS